MALLRPVTAIALLAILVTAHFALVKQAEWNGTFNLQSLLAYTTRILPNSHVPITLPSTGLPQLDNYFAFMTSFFYSSLDARNVRAHWQGNHLLGTLTSIWVVMLVEAHDSARGGAGLVAWTYVTELLGEFFGIGLFTSIWGLGYLVMTSGSSKVEGKGKGSWRALGWGLVLGHVVPSVLMLRLKPEGTRILDSQQIWTVARLFHPVFLFGFWTVLKTILPTSTGGSETGTKRKFYVFSILASGFFHITSLGFLLAPEMFPGWLNPAVSKALDPATVLIPTPFWSEAVVQKVDFETGVAVFLQWDYLCSSAAIVVWATAMYIEATGKVANKALKGGFEMMVQTMAVGVLAGPAAAAAFLMLERDGVLYETAAVGREKKTL